MLSSTLSNGEALSLRMIDHMVMLCDPTCSTYDPTKIDIATVGNSAEVCIDNYCIDYQLS